MKVSKISLFVAAVLAFVTLSAPLHADAKTKKKHHGKKASHSQASHKKSKGKKKKQAKHSAPKAQPATAAAPAAPEVVPPGEPGAGG